jgi:hypothetical protein
MNTPTFSQFRTNSMAIPPAGSGNTLPAESVEERILSCLITFVTNNNPDGSTVRGT